MRFSLRTLLILTAALAVYFALAFAAPHPANLLSMLAFTAIVPALITVAIVYGSDSERAFWIGCAAAGSAVYIILAPISMVTIWEHVEGGLDGRWVEYSQRAVRVYVASHALIITGGITAAIMNLRSSQGSSEEFKAGHP